MFYLPARGRRAAAAVSPTGPCQTKPFPVFAVPGPTKLPVLQCSTTWGDQIPMPSHMRNPLAHQIDSVCRTVGIWSAKMKCFSCLPSRPFKSCMFSPAKIHQMPLTMNDKRIDKLYDRNLDVQDFPESSVYTGLPVSRTIPTAAVWA